MILEAGLLKMALDARNRASLPCQYRTHSEDPHPAGAALFTLSSSSYRFRLVTLLDEIIKQEAFQ